jgi:ligand-binding sensor domain-containing protein
MSKTFLVIFFILAAVVCPQAQTPMLYFERIAMQDGLSNNQVNCILQDKRGFTWIGTNDGLNRYDGHNFLIFRNKPGDTASISGNTITDLFEDKDGILWIATADGGLSRYDYRLQPFLQFKQYKHLPGNPASIPANIVNAMLEDQKGYLWLATNGASVIRFDKKTGKFDQPVPTGPRVALDLAMDKQGLIWAGRQGGGIIKLDPIRMTYDYDRRYDNLYASLPHAVVSSLYRDKENNMWYGSWDKVLYHYDEVAAKEVVFQQAKTAYSFMNDEITGFAEDNQGCLWIVGKTTGLQVMNKKEKKFYNYRHNPMQEGSLADNSVRCIYIDKQGTVWLGTDKGLSICNPAQQRFKQTFLLPASGNMPVSLTIYDFYRDDNWDLWIGTSEGIFIRKDNTGEMIHLPLSYKGHRLAVTKFFRDKQNVFYIGTNYSLFIFNKTNNTIQLLPNTEKDKVMNKIIESRVVSVVEDSIDGHRVLLVSPYGHYLAYYDFVEQKWVSRLDSVKQIISTFNIRDNLIRKLYPSTAGRIWMATVREGLGEWKSNTGSVYYTNDPLKDDGLSNNHIYDMVEDVKKNLWISTYGGGLNYVDIKNNKIRHIAATNNLLEGIATDKRGNVWMISNGSLQKYDISSSSSRTYQLPDLEKSGGVKGYIYKDGEGNMYIGGNNYFIQFHPDSITDDKIKPKTWLTDFRIFNTSYSHLLNDNTINLSYRQNYFTIEFSAPDYSIGQPVQYAYMLEEFDKEWIEAGSRNNVIFSNLPGGVYTFRVRATNNPGTWTEMERTLKIIINPPFWKRWWFYAACVMFVSGSIYFLYRYRINELLKRQAIRNKIAQDLHDNVGSTLSSISVYSQVAQIQNDGGDKGELNDILGKISITSTDMISEMNDIVWAINPRNDSMEKMIQRMESFAKPLLAAKGIQFKFNYDPDILSTWLEMEKRKNLYLIFKETINNIIKYSAATLVTVNISIRNRKLELLVKDNGVGFDPMARVGEQSPSLSGNGLRNMRMRASEMRGEIRIDSKPGQGTSIHLISHIP